VSAAIFGLIVALPLADPLGVHRVTELNVIPFVGGDSDVGIGVGVVGDLAGVQPEVSPFRWRLEAAGFITFKPGEGTGKSLTIPFQDYYLLLAVPRLGRDGRMRVEVRPSFTDESTQRYYGIGNASPRPPDDFPVARTLYRRRHASLSVAGRWTLEDHLFIRYQLDYTQNWISTRPDSILAQQRTGPDPYVRSLLDGPVDHGVGAAEARLEYDTRDNEIVTHGGAFHHLRLRLCPRLGRGQPFEYGSLDLTLRVYRTPFRWLTVSARLVGDLLFGDPPFYELTRVDDSSVLGGGKGIRGVPGQRYYGKIKLYGNFEAQTPVWSFRVKGKQFILSTAMFVDGGRVWTDYTRHAELDGTGLGLKGGVGGGLRLQEGSTFIVRADLAWSPDAQPIGAYFNAGQMF
jgi:hypothetical protein